MRVYPLGRPFHGECGSADASALTEANSRFTLYAGYSTSALTLTSTDIVIVTDILVAVGATALVVWVYDGANNVVDAGELVAKFDLTAHTPGVWQTQSGHFCQQQGAGGAGVPYPKVKTSGAGQVDVTIRGFIYTHPGT